MLTIESIRDYGERKNVSHFLNLLCAINQVILKTVPYGSVKFRRRFKAGKNNLSKNNTHSKCVL